MEYDEVARAETDRGELVLRRISDERAPSTSSCGRTASS